MADASNSNLLSEEGDALAAALSVPEVEVTVGAAVTVDVAIAGATVGRSITLRDTLLLKEGARESAEEEDNVVVVTTMASQSLLARLL